MVTSDLHDMVTVESKGRYVSSRRNDSNLAPVKVRRKKEVYTATDGHTTQRNNTWLRLLFLGFCSSSTQKFFPQDRN